MTPDRERIVLAWIILATIVFVVGATGFVAGITGWVVRSLVMYR